MFKVTKPKHNRGFLMTTLNETKRNEMNFNPTLKIEVAHKLA